MSIPGFRVVRAGQPHACSAVEDRPADPVPQSLIVKYKLANRLWELVTLPPALNPTYYLGLAVPCSGTCSLDRIGGRAELVGSDVRHDASLASRVRSVTCCPSLVSRRSHGVAACRARLHHRDLATNPGAGMLDGLTRSWILKVSRFEQVQHVLSACGCPKNE
jgi:hypothetical protein